MIKKLSIVALSLLLIGIVGSIVTGKAKLKRPEIIKEVEIESHFHSINVQSNNAKVVLFPTDKEKAKIELFSNDDKAKLTANVQEKTLSVKLKEKTNKLFAFDIFPTTTTLTVYVPKRMYETIQAKNNNGYLEINDLNGKKLDLDTDNGNIIIQNMQAQDISIKTNNGRSQLNTVKANKVRIETDNGSIKINDVDADIVGKTHNGKITMTTKEMERPLALYTHNGKIEIQTDKKPTNALLDVKVDNGSVRMFGEKDWDAVIGEGENLIKLTTHNGSITVE